MYRTHRQTHSQKSELIFRYREDKQKGHPRAAKFIINYIKLKLYANLFGHEALNADSPAIEGIERIEGSRPLPGGGNSLTTGDDQIGQVFCLRHRRFDQVGPKGGSRR